MYEKRRMRCVLDLKFGIVTKFVTDISHSLYDLSTEDLEVVLEGKGI